jgi:hypothetical protein
MTTASSANEHEWSSTEAARIRNRCTQNAAEAAYQHTLSTWPNKRPCIRIGSGFTSDIDGMRRARARCCEDRRGPQSTCAGYMPTHAQNTDNVRWIMPAGNARGAASARAAALTSGERGGGGGDTQHHIDHRKAVLKWSQSQSVKRSHSSPPPPPPPPSRKGGCGVAWQTLGVRDLKFTQ